MGATTKQADGRQSRHIRAASTQAKIDLLPNAADAVTNSCAMTQGIKIGAIWTRKGETSGKEYVGLSIASPEFGPKKLCANLGKVLRADDSKLNTVI
ncbi:MAG: DUF736 family protein [Hyphomicrobiales bacterium]|nr:DUF736 family protein [Hyphomicrobiales bacterium]